VSQFKHRPVQPGSKGKVQQSFAKDADINVQIQRHMQGAGRFGAPIGNPNATRQPRFLDIASGESYHDMLNRVTQIDEMFRRLPARLRTRFSNRPELLLNFAADPNNTKEAVKLGLIDDPETIQGVLMAEAEEKARKEAEASEAAPKADKEAQPTYAQKGAKPPNPA